MIQGLCSEVYWQKLESTPRMQVHVCAHRAQGQRPAESAEGTLSLARLCGLAAQRKARTQQTILKTWPLSNPIGAKLNIKVKPNKTGNINRKTKQNKSGYIQAIYKNYSWRPLGGAAQTTGGDKLGAGMQSCASTGVLAGCWPTIELENVDVAADATVR